MNSEQEHIFCQSAALGIACGLNHRYEWLTNSIRAAEHGRYEDFTKTSDTLMDAFMAFERTTAGSEHEEEDLRKMNKDDYTGMVNKWYNRNK
jgi:hypothetical protein